jgi:YD repeat-containing protein
MAKHIDALGNATTYSYSSAFAGALPTGVCNALGQCSTTNYEFNTGLTTSGIDPNNQITSYEHDNMKRVTKITSPAQMVNGSAISGTGTISYTDTPGSLSVQSTAQQDGSTSVSKLVFFDGIGRSVATQFNDPQGNVFTQTTYDNMGRPATVSNPYRSKSEATFGITQTNYDALGRVTLLTHPDGSTEISNYSGRAVQTQDAGNGTSRVSRITQTDGLGRLASVCEVTGATQVNGEAPGACGQDIPGTGFLTTYRYDTLGNLTGVSQGSMTRSFVYDSASRLVSATNPESGTTCYQYDANGNVVKRIRPAANQGNPAVTVTTNYQYDPLNRLTLTSYSDSITPTVTKVYDTRSELGITLNNTVGRLSAEYVTSPAGQMLSGKVFSYDSRGNVIDNSQCTPGNCNSSVFPVPYSYDLLGKTLTASNGVGTVFSYTYDGAGRLSGVTSSLLDADHPGKLLSGTSYNALGALTSATLGPALNQSFLFDCRGRLTSFASAVAPAAPSPASNQTPGCPALVSTNRGVSYRGLHLYSSLPSPAWKEWMPLRSAGSILISGTAQGGKPDHGSLSVKITPLNTTEGARSLTLPYVAGDTALALAQKCASEINRDPAHRITARVKELGSAAVVELMESGTGTGAGFFVAASIQSDKPVPSITATASGPSRKMPFRLGQIQPLTDVKSSFTRASFTSR